MTPEQLAVMEQALETLEENHHLIEEHERPDYLALYDRRITALRTAIEQAKRQQALDKMAENERELGIQMQPEPVQHWCTYCQGNNAHNCQFNTTLPRVQTYVTNTTAPAAPVQESPPECQTEAEKRAYAFGWWKALEYVRQNGVIK